METTKLLYRAEDDKLVPIGHEIKISPELEAAIWSRDSEDMLNCMPGYDKAIEGTLPKDSFPGASLYCRMEPEFYVHIELDGGLQPQRVDFYDTGSWHHRRLSEDHGCDIWVDATFNEHGIQSMECNDETSLSAESLRKQYQDCVKLFVAKGPLDIVDAVVINPKRGFWCGYIALPPEHPISKFLSQLETGIPLFDEGHRVMYEALEGQWPDDLVKPSIGFRIQSQDIAYTHTLIDHIFGGLSLVQTHEGGVVLGWTADRDNPFMERVGYAATEKESMDINRRYIECLNSITPLKPEGQSHE